MAEQQLLQLNQEAVELRRQIDVAYDEWKATTDPDTKKTFERQFTRLVDKEGELEARRKALETRIEGVFLPVAYAEPLRSNMSFPLWQP